MLVKDLPNQLHTERTLVLAGAGFAPIESLLRQRQAIEITACESLADICREPAELAGLVIAVEDVLVAFDPAELQQWLAAQPPWSDVSIVLVATGGGGGRRLADALGNVNLVQAPFAEGPLLSLVDGLLRARARQRATRDLERRLAACEMRFRALFENLAVGVAEIGRDGRVLSGNSRLRETLGLDGPRLARFDLAARIQAEDRPVYREMLDAVLEGRADARTAELRRLSADGVGAWLRITAERAPALRAEDAHCILVVEDISARKQAEGLRRTLLRELSHRVKNTLAIIQALAKQTARSTGSKEDFLAAFQGRVASLANTHGLLTDTDWSGIELRALIETELRKESGDQAGELRLEGPGLLLSPSVATTVGMAVHELATNALRHGALSVPGGVVAVEWRVVPVTAGEALRLAWREMNGPAVQPPTREGFGMRLVRSSAKADLRFAPGGLEGDIEFLLRPASA